jgi:hypothetical protein
MEIKIKTQRSNEIYYADVDSFTEVVESILSAEKNNSDFIILKGMIVRKEDVAVIWEEENQ